MSDIPGRSRTNRSSPGHQALVRASARLAPLRFVLACAAASPTSLRAQCPDGSPPPCRPSRSAQGTPGATSVAVLTLGLLSRDTTDVYLAEGLADAIASRLGQSGRLVVTSRTYVRRLRGVATLPPADLGRALNAAYLVSGTLLRSGARLHVTVELVRAATGRQAWSQEFDRG